MAERHLRRQGMRTLARRYATPAGEIDLVMRDRDAVVVFVEVKTQRDRTWQDPHERVTPAKQARLVRAARDFVQRKRLRDAPCRFDVVSVIIPEEGRPEVRHDADAFAPRDW